MKIWNLVSGRKNKKADKDTDMDMDIVRKKMIFKGNVQFVGFRYRAKCFADELELTGFVENLDNGNVLMEVQGTEEKIRRLIQCLKESRPIRIDAIQEELLPLKREKGFRYYY